VTIIGAFAGDGACWASPSTCSTLFGIVLAIGIVVDDAIVDRRGRRTISSAGMNAHDAAIKAMDELFGPIIGITLVLMSVFLPAAFLPGLTGQMFAQFALVIAATALISAINAATLKPTQCALWLRPRRAAGEAQLLLSAASTASTMRWNAAYRRPDRPMVHHGAWLMVIVGSRGSAWPAGACRACRPPSSRSRTRATCMPSVQLPDGASLERTDRRAASGRTRSPWRARCRASRHVVAISAASRSLDNNASLANAGVAYIILKGLGHARGRKDQDLLADLHAADADARPEQDGQGLSCCRRRRSRASAMPAASRCRCEHARRQLRLHAKLQAITDMRSSRNASTQSEQPATRAPRSAPTCPAVRVDGRPRTKAETLFASPVGDVFTTLSSDYGLELRQRSSTSSACQPSRSTSRPMRSTAQARRHADKLHGAQPEGDMVPIGAIAGLKLTALAPPR
jgi:HAE1 family hydrophobic/amphiphilic exporter-1